MFADIPDPKRAMAPAESVAPIGERAARGGMKKLLLIVGGVVLLIVIGVVVWLAFFRNGTEQLAEPTTSVVAPTDETSPTPPVAAPTDVPAEAPPVVTPSVAAPADSDGDGLSDVDETRLGTDPQKADIDNDGLTDGEEVNVYRTNPLNADTDGDTFKDGAEVRAGYDPNAVGKRLFEIPPAA